MKAILKLFFGFLMLITEEINQNLGTQIARYGEPIGYCPTGYWKRVSVVLLNNFDDGFIDAEQQIGHMSRRGNHYIR